MGDLVDRTSGIGWLHLSDLRIGSRLNALSRPHARGLLQYHQIIELCEEGVARYDLGTEMDYKRRWAEDVMETEMLVLVR